MPDATTVGIGCLVTGRNVQVVPNAPYARCLSCGGCFLVRVTKRAATRKTAEIKKHSQDCGLAFITCDRGCSAGERSPCHPIATWSRRHLPRSDLASALACSLRPNHRVTTFSLLRAATPALTCAQAELAQGKAFVGDPAVEPPEIKGATSLNAKLGRSRRMSNPETCMSASCLLRWRVGSM